MEGGEEIEFVEENPYRKSVTTFLPSWCTVYDFEARPPPTDKHHKRRSTLNKFSRGEKAAGTGSWKRENGRETKWNLLKIGERRLEERKTPTWRDSNARSDSERDFHSFEGILFFVLSGWIRIWEILIALCSYFGLIFFQGKIVLKNWK